MATGECSAYSSLQADLKVKFADSPTSWRSPGADRISLKGRKVNSRMRLRAEDDSTIKYGIVYYYYYYNKNTDNQRHGKTILLLILVLLLLTTTTKNYYCPRESIASISLQLQKVKISFSLCGALKQSYRVLRPN